MCRCQNPLSADYGACACELTIVMNRDLLKILFFLLKKSAEYLHYYNNFMRLLECAII